MSVDELRAGFERLTAPVVPDPDPYQQILRRARQRRRRWFSALLAAVTGALTLALVGPGPLSVAGLLDRGLGPDGYPVTSDWVWRLIQSPTRGNLNIDSTLLTDVTERLRTESDLPKAKVLFLHDFSSSRIAVVAHYSDEAAMVSTYSASRGASAARLADQPHVRNAHLDPFKILSGKGERDALIWRVGLAPAGCRVATSATRIQQDPQIQRSWRPAPTGDFVAGEWATEPGELWQVTCGDKVRQRIPATGDVREIGDGGPPPSAQPIDPQWHGPVDANTARAAAASYDELTRAAAVSPENAVVRWTGFVFDGQKPTPAVLIAPKAGPGPVVLHVGTSSKTLAALAPREQAAPQAPAASRVHWSLAATAPSSDSGLIAIRIPERDGGYAVASDQLLVVARSSAKTVQVIDNGGSVLQSAKISDDGSAILQLPDRDAHWLHAVSDDGRLDATTLVVEPAKGGQLFGENLVWDWS